MGTTRTHEYVTGEVLALKYRLIRVLGQGGMGSVWLARNIALEVNVAVKLILRELASAEAAERLLQEARAAARLVHPSIVRIFDFGESEHGDPFIVMEVLAGESLADVLAERKRLPAAAAVRTLLPVASALVAAHAKGVVHRDLKPDNIVLVDDGNGGVLPKVVDFGIARVIGERPADRRLTRAGAVVGSVAYMSPEQARGRDDVDHRADVWAYSVMMYEALTGNLPFAAPNHNAMLTAILERTPAPTTHHGAGDAALWAIVSRGLAKDRVERWPTMRALGEALATWAFERGCCTDVAGTSLDAHWLADPSQPDASGPPSMGDRVSRFESYSDIPVREAPDNRITQPIIPAPASSDTTYAAPNLEAHDSSRPVASSTEGERPRNWRTTALTLALAANFGLWVAAQVSLRGTVSARDAAPLVAAQEARQTDRSSDAGGVNPGQIATKASLARSIEASTATSALEPRTKSASPRAAPSPRTSGSAAVAPSGSNGRAKTRPRRWNLGR